MRQRLTAVPGPECLRPSRLQVGAAHDPRALSIFTSPGRSAFASSCRFITACGDRSAAPASSRRSSSTTRITSKRPAIPGFFPPISTDARRRKRPTGCGRCFLLRLRQGGRRRTRDRHHAVLLLTATGPTETTLIPPLLFFEAEGSRGQDQRHPVPARPDVLSPGAEDLAGPVPGLGYYYREAKSDENPEEKVRAGYFPWSGIAARAPRARPRYCRYFLADITGLERVTPRSSRCSSTVAGKTKSHFFISPLGGQYHDGPAAETTTLWLAPLVLRRQSPASDVTVIPPVAAWWRNKQTGHSAGYAGLYFFSRDDSGRSEGLLPCFSASKTTSRRNVHRAAALATFHRSPQLRMGFVGPVWLVVPSDG